MNDIGPISRHSPSDAQHCLRGLTTLCADGSLGCKSCEVGRCFGATWIPKDKVKVPADCGDCDVTICDEAAEGCHVIIIQAGRGIRVQIHMQLVTVHIAWQGICQN